MKRNSHRKGHRFSQFLYTLSLAFLAFGLFILGWVVWPTPTDAVQFNIPAGPLPGAPNRMELASRSEYALNISWPRWLRRDEVGLIHLRLTDLDCGEACEDQEPRPGGNASSMVQIVLVEPALYPLQITPPGSVQSNLGDDQDLLLTWEVTGTSQGDFPGKMFISFGFYCKASCAKSASQNDNDAPEELIAVPVAVVDLHIRVIELWGLDSGMVIWFGLVSLVLWGVLFVVGRLVAE